MIIFVWYICCFISYLCDLVGAEGNMNVLKRISFIHKEIDMERKRRERQKIQRRKKLTGKGDNEEQEIETIVFQHPKRPEKKLTPEERLARMRHSSQHLCHELKQKIVTLKRALVKCKTPEHLVPIARAVRNINAVWAFCD